MLKSNYLHCKHIFHGSLLPHLSCTGITRTYNTIDLITLRIENLMQSLAGRSRDFVVYIARA